MEDGHIFIMFFYYMKDMLVPSDHLSTFPGLGEYLTQNVS